MVFHIVYVLLGISPASICSLPTFRNHVSVPSLKAGSRLCGVRKGKAICTVARYGNGVGQANGKVGGSGWVGGCGGGRYKRRVSGSSRAIA
jgi:hypothetical protein